MHTFKLNIKTITPCGNFSCIENQFIAWHKGYIYFINVKKLDIILSLMELLFEFNEYITNTNERNITEWIREKGLATTELFEEISYYKLKYDRDEHILCINNFFKEEETSIEEKSLEEKICIFLKENFKTIVMVDFFNQNKDILNDYVSNLLSFCEQNPRFLFTKPDSFNFFVNCIVEMDKLKLSEKIYQMESLKIRCNIQEKYEKIFSIEKILSPTHTFYQECLQKNIELKFNITCAEDNLFFLNLEKILQLYLDITSMRIKQEKEYLEQKMGVFSRYTDNLTQDENFEQEVINFANFSFIDTNKMLFFNLDEVNKKRMNRLLTLNRLDPFLDKDFYFICAQKNKLKFLNYAKIKILG